MNTGTRGSCLSDSMLIVPLLALSVFGAAAVGCGDLSGAGGDDPMDPGRPAPSGTPSGAPGNPAPSGTPPGAPGGPAPSGQPPAGRRPLELEPFATDGFVLAKPVGWNAQVKPPEPGSAFREMVFTPPTPQGGIAGLTVGAAAGIPFTEAPLPNNYLVLITADIEKNDLN